MKKRVLFLLPLFLGACSDDEKSPVITIEKLFVKVENSEGGDGDEKNYANCTDELPAVKVGDKVDALLSLDGNGFDLKTFNLQSDDDVRAELRYDEGLVSTEGNLTDKEKGQLRFKDGVSKAKVLVNAIVEHVDKNGNVKLSFYLSSKAECEGAQEEIDLKTETKE